MVQFAKHTRQAPVHRGDIVVPDPQTGRQWRIPRKAAKAVHAQVQARWFINMAVDTSLFRMLVPASFLMPQIVRGRMVVSLCLIHMQHGAPGWAPLQWGPSCHNAALRVGCIDSRTGEPCVWVDERHTDSCLGPVLKWLGFPPLCAGLSWQQHADDTFELQTQDPHLACRAQWAAAEGLSDWQPTLFDSAESLNAYVAAGVRAYGPGVHPGELAVLDLIKQDQTDFEYMAHLCAQVRTPLGSFAADGVYRSLGGVYRWDLVGFCDKDGAPLKREVGHA